MGAAVVLRLDHSAVDLRRLARASSDSDQVRRLLALAVIYACGSRREAAQVGGVGLQTVRDWVLRFNERGPAGLVDGKAPGARALLNDTQRAALAGIVEAGPVLAEHGGALAGRRSGRMGAGSLRDHAQCADHEPRVAGTGLSQAVGAAPASCARRGRDCGL